MRRTILLLVTDLEIGGTPTVVRELAIRLHRREFPVHVACLSKWGPTADAIKAAGVDVTPLDARSVADVAVVRRLIRLIRDADIGTVFSFLVHANVAAAVASRFCPGVRWLQSIQTTQPKPAWHWTAQRFAARAAVAVVVPSRSVATVAEQRSGIGADKLIVIPNGVDLEQWRRSPIPAADPRPYPVVFVGRLDPIKDVPTLIHAINRCPPGSVKLDIYGDGPERSKIVGMPGDSVTMHGSIARPQAAIEFAGLLVLPSLAEGFGLVLIEAMAAGVPVVATNVPGIRDVITHNRTGLLVPPGDPFQLSAAILRVVNDAELRHRLIEAGLAEVRQYDWAKVIDIYEELPLHE